MWLLKYGYGERVELNMINSLELGKKVIKDKIPLIPKNPGVYKMLSSTGEILYIGKAKNIPNSINNNKYS